jgi:ATP phosphoribosyltransferase regulatory subunit
MANGNDRTLPTGMRDVLPEESRARRALSRALSHAVALHGFELVTLPAFEFEAVLERGLGPQARAELLRFVDPETGAVVALRPDMTPQIARLAATRLREWPPPLRFAYEGTVVRRRGARAIALSQFGIELLDAPGSARARDLELLDVAAAALRAAGVERFTLDVGDAAILRALLAPLPPDLAALVGDAFARRDEPELRKLLQNAGSSAAPLQALVRIAGGPEAIAAARASLRGTAAEPYVARLASTFDAAEARGLPVSVDFGEIRGWSYYTGLRFHVYAEGSAHALGGGGRYDELPSAYGRPLEAVGFSVDLDALRAAVVAQRGAAPGRARVLVVASSTADAATTLLRENGIPAVVHAHAGSPEDASTWARAWGFSHILDGDVLRELATGARIAWNATAVSSLVTSSSSESGA